MEIKIYDKYVQEAKTVREEVFIYEQGFSYDYDKNDNISAHFVLFQGDAPLAACRVFKIDDSHTFMMGRLAVKKEYRGRGLGSKMIEAVKEYVAQTEGKVIILHSQLHARDFYKKQGFSEFGEVEYEDGCPHIGMKIEL